MSRDDRNWWFHGKITREHAEELLKKEGNEDGTYLIRESNSAAGDYVLNLLFENNVMHYQIHRHGEDAFFSIDDKVKILHGLDTLVEFYQQAANGLVTKLKTHIKSGPPPNESRSQGVTNLLLRATKNNNLTVVSELLKCGYRNVDAKNEDGQTAMHIAALHCNEAILKLLLEAGVNVNCMDSAGNTPLHYACRQKSASFIRALIEGRANVQARNMKNGFVPLHEAAKHGNLEAVQELLNAHAPYLPRTSFGEFPIDLAKEQNHEPVISYLSSFKLPAANTQQSQWYHGTLKREEATEILREFAQNIQEKTVEKGESTIDTSGCFLVRFSESTNAGSGYVLTLLWNDTGKNYIICQSSKYLYIDDGPYHPSLEHLVEHFMRFADGLPVNLKYAVPPKPKPPLPLFSTMPKVKPTSPPNIQSTKLKPTQRQQTLNEKPTMPIQHAHTLNPRRKISGVVFNTLRLRSPKKGKTKSGAKSLNKTCQNVDELKHAEQLLKSLSFSTEFSTKKICGLSTEKNSTVDDFYNVPKNNAAIDAAVANLPAEQKTEAEVEYFTKSDLAIEHTADGLNVHQIGAKLPLNVNCYISAAELCEYLNNSPLLNEDVNAATAISEESLSDTETLKIIQAKHYIIPQSCLELNTIIGEGEFGSVYKGCYKQGNQQLEVAVKTLRDEHCRNNKQAFLREAAVMMQLRHHCIVKLIGISRSNTLMMVQELITIGSMLDYILANKNDSNLQYELKLWSAQIACGMQYLESCHFVHRDLAARNILLASQNQAKISDFGLSRAMCKDNDFYQQCKLLYL